ncbi:MAG: hypothetical protein M1820_006633 [Bogoriella megaspora]|nr:MAG: hypothetical protein M1820_006633 [Bogoriella megaspora]
MPQGCPTHRNREGYNVVARCLESLGSGRRREADLIADLDGYAKANGIVADKDDPATSRFGGRAGINAEDSSSTERLFDEEAAEYDNATGQSLDSAEELRICMNKFSIEEKGLQQRQTIDPNKKSRKARYDPLEEIKQPQVDKGFDMYANKSFSEAVAEPRDSTPKSENKKQQKKELVLKAAEKRAKKFGTSRSKIKARKDKQNVVLVEEEEELRI